MSDSSGGLADLTAVILAGGLGTRLRGAVGDRQKVMAEVGGRPFITYLLDQLVEFGLGAGVLCTGYLGQETREVLGESYRGLHLRYSQEDTPLGTGGALRLALPLAGSTTVLVLNGDTYCEADLAAFYARHIEAQAVGSLVVAHAADGQRFGQVELNAEGWITAFIEKSQRQTPGWISAGIYLLRADLIATIPEGAPASLESTMFPSWIARGLLGFRTQGRFLDIGTAESYGAAEDFFKAAQRVNGQA